MEEVFGEELGGGDAGRLSPPYDRRGILVLKGRVDWEGRLLHRSNRALVNSSALSVAILNVVSEARIGD